MHAWTLCFNSLQSLQWRNQFWKSLEEDAAKRFLECGLDEVLAKALKEQLSAGTAFPLYPPPPPPQTAPPPPPPPRPSPPCIPVPFLHQTLVALPCCCLLCHSRRQFLPSRSNQTSTNICLVTPGEVQGPRKALHKRSCRSHALLVSSEHD